MANTLSLKMSAQLHLGSELMIKKQAGLQLGFKDTS